MTVLVFTKIPPKEVLEGRVQFDEISCQDITNVMMRDGFFRQSYTQLECESYARSVIDYVTQKTAWQYNRPVGNMGHLNAFDLLLLTLKDLLVMDQNHFDCSYEHIFSWRMIVRFMGEELALSARYALWDREHAENESYRKYFDWSYVTAHNNKQLNMIVRRGISDHHCHLWGSTPYFHVSWVNLMNQLTNSLYIQNLQRLAPVQWSAENVRKSIYDEEPDAIYSEAAQLRAAWIRLYLCERLAGKDPEGTASVKCTCIENVRCYANWRQLLQCRNRLQAALETYTYIAKDAPDYALTIAQLKKTNHSSDYDILVGERWLYYRVFMDYCKPQSQRHLTNNDYNLFLAYFLIRLQIRSKMVQSNDFIGFDNFQKIERRKWYFLGDSKSERALTRLAINETLKKPYIKELEVRLSPDVEQIGRLERAVNAKADEDAVEQLLAKLESRGDRCTCQKTGADLTSRYYYVFHFIKEGDPSGYSDTSYNHSLKTNRICQHDKLRQKIMLQAKTIIRFREQQPHLACRVLGIDAASQEIGCRPEVFGTVYRLLGDHQLIYNKSTKEALQLPALGKTYHVGEDFIDIVDGLRAIDEVIHFLDYDCGDRLGHAVVLGINVEEWYEKKHFGISIRIQDYLDNLAWFYHALNHFSVPNVNALKERLVNDFEYWFRIVYRNSISDKQIKVLMESARKNWYDRTNEDHDRYHYHTCHFDIMDYYRAWTLRGDDPSCYVDGYFKKPVGSLIFQHEEKCKVNEKFPVRYEDRYVAEYSLLNYLYQFDNRVRCEGSRRIKIDISADYIRAAKAIQIEMRSRIAKKGISVETNPTSNVLIGTFRRYEKHPILSFYNRGLPVTEKEERECAQIQVSINTDDSGVFYTDLETEYALLARSVEQIVGDDNGPRFKKYDIYTWLDNIRIMGIDQTFRNLENDRLNG